MILEKFTQSKYGEDLYNEDSIFCGETLIGVFDGATSKSNSLVEGITAGRFASSRASHLLEFYDGSAFNEHDYFAELNEILASKVEMLKFTSPRMFPRVSCIIYDSLSKRVVSYGDCQFSLNGVTLTHPKGIDVLLSNIRSEFYSEYIGEFPDESILNQKTDWGRNLILPILKEQYRFENSLSDWGYPVINGIKYEPNLISEWKVDAGDEIILASDGYLELFGTLEESENYLFSYLRKDPLLIGQYRSTKGVLEGQVSFDDRTYCRVLV